ncbi:hypothetical protein HAPAU_29520 [Halalkalicoccus paucihalophilus]|uniref:Uncharacterized protein n=1 Tax=Halalkalicoccus paucihalophilus TaxID=1008153 RepID=A0A151ABR3_9EURY|nr:hypothetical protein HAPAU_29520 [Halalkalicoccus paucihalophilus]
MSHVSLGSQPTKGYSALDLAGTDTRAWLFGPLSYKDRKISESLAQVNSNHCVGG